MTALSRGIYVVEIIFLIFLLGGIGYLSWQLLPEDTKSGFQDTIVNLKPRNSSPLPLVQSSSPSPSPITLPLPAGPQTYRFSFGSEVVGPRPVKLTIDPLTPSKDNNAQSIAVQAKYDQPISSVGVELITDNSTQKQSLTRTAGTDLDGTWSGSWQLRDSYNQKYGLRLILTSTKTYDNIMWFRN